MGLVPSLAIIVGTVFWLAVGLIGFFAAARISKENTQYVEIIIFIKYDILIMNNVIITLYIYSVIRLVSQCKCL